ncbi:ABC transporter ATP-binding protein [Nesterenkonia sp. Act20]|uniref:ABC transporter ATP-binding protein n=1 Tax=Nesterenkonia sp. Act20 TaxID=1483432 RepID=UPI001C495B99|nr:ATP-binding cassette domain-containing protein [Nesterenkonia sp. Act20]
MTTTSPSIEISHLAKSYGSTQAVTDVTFSAESGRVLALLGPNGAGKTTTMRILLGLATAESGHALIDGRAYSAFSSPAHRVGAVLDAGGLHPDRTAREHLRITAAMIGGSQQIISPVLEQVGLAEAADRPVRGYSLGMRQRLALANALLGDPSILVLDEPANGLDPAGIRWLRQYLRSFAAQGGTVLLSTHVLTEVSLVADDLVIIDRGRSLITGALDALTADSDLEQLYLSMTSAGSDRPAHHTPGTPAGSTSTDRETLR